MNRLELKFEISNLNEGEIIRDLKLTKEFQDRDITSIYYDTNSFKYYNDSEEGLTPRKKVRVRYYNNLLNSKNLEIKYTLPTYRNKITFNNIKENLIGEYLKEINISEDIKPKILVSYTRKYFKNRKGRFNIDYNIFCQGLNDKKILKVNFKSKKILEFKTLNINEKFKFLSKFPLKENRSSKYCEAIQNLYKI